jgi:phage-related protein
MDFVCVEDYERRAQSMFNNPEELDYFNAAACLGNTARNNIEAYKKYNYIYITDSISVFVAYHIYHSMA